MGTTDGCQPKWQFWGCDKISPDVLAISHLGTGCISYLTRCGVARRYDREFYLDGTRTGANRNADQSMASISARPPWLEQPCGTARAGATVATAHRAASNLCKLEVKNLTVIPPQGTQAALKLVHFELFPGQALGVIGPYGAGKSTLARALNTIWAPASGTMRLDDASPDHYDPALRAAYIRYLPQQVHFFNGSISQNIARMAAPRDPKKIASAAQKAGAHEMIQHLPEGYDAMIGAVGMQLSGGQMQQIGLAHALYSDSVILTLDEPNSNLDNAGTTALNRAIGTDTGGLR